MNGKWDSYRRLRGFAVLSLTAIPVLSAAGFVIGTVFSPEQAGWLATVGAYLGMAVVFVAMLLLTLWQCPRCGLPFCCRSWFSNVLTSKCVHCGLEKYDPEFE